MKKVVALKEFTHQGRRIAKGTILYINEVDLVNLVEERKVRVLQVPENRTYK